MQDDGSRFDAVGEETLRALSEAPRFNRWLYAKVERYVGRKVLEVGAGTGNITECIRAERVVATDRSARYLGILRRKFASDPHVTVLEFDLSGGDPSRFAPEGIDTVLCLNVLEHVEDDAACVRRMSGLLVPSGRLVLLVPYAPSLYCGIDRELGHFRRYSRNSVREVVSRNGFVVERVFLFNLFGGIGWFVRGKVFGDSRLRPGPIRAFERLVPLFRIAECLGTPFGASVVCIGRKADLVPDFGPGGADRAGRQF